MDSDQPVRVLLAEAMRLPLCLRDEEAAGSNPATPTEKWQVTKHLVTCRMHYTGPGCPILGAIWERTQVMDCLVRRMFGVPLPN